MPLYASKSNQGFYDDAIHGSRTMVIIDPAWNRPTTTITLEPGESYVVDGQAMENTGEEPITLNDVPDMKVEPPTITVPNPGCRIPVDAVEIPGEEHAALLAAQSGGKVIDWSGDLPVAVDPPAPTLEQQRTSMLAAINAGRNRLEVAGFPYLGKVMDSNPRSVQRITTAALAAQAALAAGQPFSLDWTCADNSVLTLDAVGVIGMPVALAQHAAALHAHAKTLKEAAGAAIDQAELGAIDIQAGWPGEVL